MAAAVMIWTPLAAAAAAVIWTQATAAVVWISAAAAAAGTSVVASVWMVSPPPQAVDFLFRVHCVDVFIRCLFGKTILDNRYTEIYAC